MCSTVQCWALDMLALEFSGLNSSFQGVRKGQILDRVGNRYKLCILGDLNGWIGDRMRAGITGTFGVTGENDNGRRVVVLFAERVLCMGNT